MIGSRAGAVVILCLFGTAVMAEDAQPDPSGTYLCKLTASAGLRLDVPSQTWAGTVFNVRDEAILMKVVDTGKTGTYQTALTQTYKKYMVSFKAFGSQDKARECVSSFLSGQFSSEVPIMGGRLDCRYFGTQYRVDYGLKRIQINFDGAFLDDWKENQDTPYVAVGTCEKV
ncbi:hypothetical protein O9X99_02055 [Agrobacterium salinitolerans]|uniref:Uncharacterized protein n=1 Tax=Agrobacterium salinitolerans TaxID=1183413 RepID=A0ABY3BUQ9_9HYPH|nr:MULTISPECIES: hypothetical protein [Agrobacterium]MCZ7890451.1 hypothetical protein [Agrobacterium salinitolerans]TRA96827.1 hypothetical protein EXN23_00900 [Agrobacterium salinitolerans]